MAGTSTGSGPICITHSMNISEVRMPAAGAPTTHSPRPPSTAWNSAVSTTPAAIARAAFAASTTLSSPRAPPMRRATRLTSDARVSPCR